jgi:hypothetical protein
VAILDAAGSDKAPVARGDSAELAASGEWKDGRWQVVFKRSLETELPADFQFSLGQYIPIAFANWDGLAGQQGSQRSFTAWHWIILEAPEDPVRLYGLPAGTGLLAGLLFIGAARRTRRKHFGEGT